MKADILLLDEPTNHLDVKNVAWLEDYLISQTTVSSMIVSHDSGFLDRVCTHIIHYETRKLVTYKGNLTEFIRQCPAAKKYTAASMGPPSSRWTSTATAPPGLVAMAIAVGMLLISPFIKWLMADAEKTVPEHSGEVEAGGPNMDRKTD